MGISGGWSGSSWWFTSYSTWSTAILMLSLQHPGPPGWLPCCALPQFPFVCDLQRDWPVKPLQSPSYQPPHPWISSSQRLLLYLFLPGNSQLLRHHAWPQCGLRNDVWEFKPSPRVDLRVPGPLLIPEHPPHPHPPYGLVCCCGLSLALTKETGCLDVLVTSVLLWLLQKLVYTRLTARFPVKHFHSGW